MRRSALVRSSTALLVSALGASACGGAPPEPVATPDGARPKSSKPRTPFDGFRVDGARLIPDHGELDGSVGVDEGGEAILFDRMRILERPDGSIERAFELLPIGRIVALGLPSRLGGGYVFTAVGGAGTQIWRAERWLGDLSPLVSLSAIADDQRPVVAGFDRLYVRIKSGNRLIAIDPEDGSALSLGPLPPAPSFGEMVFVDGWRAVVDADLRGPLATFDAGATWKPIDYDGRVLDVGIEDDRAVLHVEGGRLELDARGGLTVRRHLETSAAEDEAEVSRPAGPLGKRPLRAAIEDGWPDSPSTVVVAREGLLARVSLADGRVLDRKEDAYPEEMTRCHAIRLGDGFGFVCGEPEGATAIFRFEAPMSMAPVLSFREPRFVAPSGNGAVVVRGGCGDGAEPDEEARSYCILDRDGQTREIRVRGDLGAERVVALADGRVAVIVPPRPGAGGQLSIIDGSAARHVALTLPAEPAASIAEVRRGLWLEGFEERRAGVLGGWVESGGPLVGIEIGLDGKVRAGEVKSARGAVVGGRFGVFLGEEGEAFETTDGGMTFAEIELPETSSDLQGTRTRVCGPAGCVLPGWIRTGWGEPSVARDLAEAKDPEPLYLRGAPAPRPLSLTCSVASSAARPAAGSTSGGKLDPVLSPSGLWQSFRGVSPPALEKDEVGVDAGAPFDAVPLRAYVWGRRGADWRRAGRFLVRFEDRFDVAGGQHKTALTAPPWPDEETTAEAIGAPPRHNASWTAFLDPGGDAALLSACRGRGCALFVAAEGQPVALVRDRNGIEELVRPLVQGVVRSGDTWFLLAPDESPDRIGLWRIDLGVARPLRTLLRPARPRFAVAAAPRLVRRALGPGVGLLTTAMPEPGAEAGRTYVFPIDPASGALGEPVSLGAVELGARPLAACGPSQDGWLVELAAERPEPNIDVPVAMSLDAVEARVRVDPGSLCVEAFAARVDVLSGDLRPGTDAKRGTMPLVVNEGTGAGRAVLACAQVVEPAPASDPD